jgi:hypothetical protein
VLSNKKGAIPTLALLGMLATVPRPGFRSVEGVVTDKAGNLLEDAVVQLENTTTLAVRSYITQTDGRYYFQELSSEIDYTVRAHYRNCWSSQKTLSRFDSSTHKKLDLVVPASESNWSCFATNAP